jgi:hypothetical protein
MIMTRDGLVWHIRNMPAAWLTFRTKLIERCTDTLYHLQVRALISTADIVGLGANDIRVDKSA